MQNTKDTILFHINKYPKMQIQDLVKLLYQSEFAGGHMIADRKHSLAYLEQELSEINPDKTSLFEDIGNDMLRLQLSAAKSDGISVELINNIFIETANSNNGSKEKFQQRLNVLLKLCELGTLPFKYDECKNYIQNYLDSGAGAVHHSKIYRENYHPAYRVISKKYALFFDLLLEIEKQLSEKAKVVIAVDGMAGSGKTTLANSICKLFGGEIIQLDSFFLPTELRTPERLSEIGGNIHYERFLEEVLLPLKNNSEIAYKIFDCSNMQYNGIKSLTANKLVICEGSYSLHPNFLETSVYDITVSLKCNSETQKSRIVNRSGTELYKKFETLWIPMENNYIKENNIFQISNFLFDTSDIFNV